MTDVVQRSAELDLDAAGALRALVDPDVLSTWLGRWEPGGGAGAVVTTDDGVRREVADLRVGPSGVTWRWRPADEPDAWSDVAIEVEHLSVDRSRVTVREVPTAAASIGRDATPGLDGLKWSVCLLVLQIAAASTAPAPA
ncbi:hypothetical protein [Dermatobacter hominis]|uniref:hypothetical protein n=1 Tax=Dermatobacter hominis TaxID=2884263 RepID=UPI001D11E407|nr:hypothetical protein [Dermatobacter hominis]UDY35300.1 hypothetical protein LH044_18435 [Dermatobacter hominis]